jgi:hypothetical protein
MCRPHVNWNRNNLFFAQHFPSNMFGFISTCLFLCLWTLAFGLTPPITFNFLDSTETGKVFTYTYCAFEEKQMETSNMTRFLQILITMSNQIKVNTVGA